MLMGLSEIIWYFLCFDIWWHNWSICVVVEVEFGPVSSISFSGCYHLWEMYLGLQFGLIIWKICWKINEFLKQLQNFHLQTSPHPTVIIAWVRWSHSQQLVGSLICWTITGPNISGSVNLTSQFMAAPCWHLRMVAVQRIISYLKGRPNRRLFFHTVLLLIVMLSGMGVKFSLINRMVIYFGDLGKIVFSNPSRN